MLIALFKVIFLSFTAPKLNIMKGVIALTILAIVLCTDIVLANDCDQIVCTTDYAPVCGEDSNGNQKTYANECLYRVAICEDSGIGEHPEGHWKTYDNRCELDNAICKHAGKWVVKDGECRAEKCLKECPDIYDPLCGDDSEGNWKIYHNLCLFEIEVCKNPGIRLVDEGKCSADKCVKPCPRIYEPVCGEDSEGYHKNYDNLCLFEIAACKNPGMRFAGIGECSADKCLKDCPYIYDPVCGEDSEGNQKIYHNLCLFKIAVCKNPGTRFVGKGECNANKCLKPCPLISEPVCVEDSEGNQQMYSNLCFFEIAACENPGIRFIKEGGCNANVCSKPCPRIHIPVCGEDSEGNQKIYSNLCELENAVCENPGIRFVREGGCDADKCSKPCPRIYAPVFGVDPEGNQKIYGNLCEFEIAVCENPDIRFVREGERNVDKCSKPCLRIYYPVCGVDPEGNQKTYANLCVFENAVCENPGIRFVREGECNVDKCSKPCPRTYDPVCGEYSEGNQETYFNLCEFEIAVCEDPVCGEYSEGNQETYFNLCEFEIAVCEDPGIRFIKEGGCNANGCSKPCPRIKKEDVTPMDVRNHAHAYMIQFVVKIQKEIRRFTLICASLKMPFVKIQVSDLFDKEDVTPINVRNHAHAYPICGEDSEGNRKTFCGEDSEGNRKTYANLCEFEIALCCASLKLPCVKIQVSQLLQKKNVAPINIPKEIRRLTSLKFQLNLCEFEIAACKNPDIRFVRVRECNVDKCSKGCPRIYDPVCGVDPEGSDLLEYENIPKEIRRLTIICAKIRRFTLICASLKMPFVKIQVSDLLGKENVTSIDVRNCVHSYIVQFAVKIPKEIRRVTVVYAILKLPFVKIQVSDLLEEEDATPINVRNHAHAYMIQFVVKIPKEISRCTIMCASLKLRLVKIQVSDFLQKENVAPINVRNHAHAYMIQFVVNIPKEIRRRTLICASLKLPFVKIQDPVCGEYSEGNQETYFNLCEFEIAVCEDPGMRFVGEGECNSNKCSKPCPYIYDPVCGEDSEGNQGMYPNLCVLEIAVCENPDIRFVGKGECSVDKCLKECPAIVDPVCGEDSEGNQLIYANLCLFEIAVCEDPAIRFVKEGGCSVDKCMQPCPRFKDPVCTVNSKGNLETYANWCMFENAVCENPGILVVNKGKCMTDKCSKPCSRLYDPVCTVDSKRNSRTHDNWCLFEIALCENPDLRVVKKGECGPDECVKACPRYHYPVCTVDSEGNGKTYANWCTFEIALCENRALRVVKIGRCEV
ncbi:Kazal-type serine protease inhibitor domain [Popillia japonica]|uniref:Kazal-type serine protease inhibitor domain n=1 Tax=Popillia japonica TaxID=7064 RepID=A0AAW1J0Y4_POPJA